MLNEGLLDSLRALLGQPASINALRAGLFLFGVLAAIAWLRRIPRLGVLMISAGGTLGLSYWLIQISSPFGLETNDGLTRQWAQAGVNAFAEPRGPGFVWGTTSENSLIGALAAAGVPMRLVFLIPQISVLLGLATLMAFPWGLLRNRTTAAFAVCLGIGGGLWPGMSPYGSLLLRPSLGLATAFAFGLVLLLARQHKTRRLFNRARLGLAVGLTAAAALCRAWEGGLESSATGSLLLVAASTILASPLRVTLRRACPSGRATRRVEAMVLLGAFCGSGLFWWTPKKSVDGFEEATDDRAALRRPLAWMAENVPAGDVILASPAYSAPIAALTGRRVLFPSSGEGGGGASLSEPFRRARLAESTLRGQPITRLANAFSVTHLFLGPGEASPLPTDGAYPGDEPRLGLVLAYQDAEDFRVFRVARK